MNTNPTESNESNECGRDCFGCNQEGENRNLCRKSNVLYNWECNVKDVCPDTGYDGQTSKNNFTRSSQHTSLYESWARYQNKVINPKTKKPYSKPQSHCEARNQTEGASGPRSSSSIKKNLILFAIHIL